MNSSHEEKRRFERVSPDRNREELIFSVLSLPVESDPRLTNLVETINDLPDVYTCSSCGGHPDLENRENPAPEGCFYVQFIVEPTEAGFLSLGILDLAARNVDPDNLAVKVLNTTNSPKLAIFHILGKEGADPGAVAGEIRALCRTWGVSLEGVSDYKKNVRRLAARERIRGSPSGGGPGRG